MSVLIVLLLAVLSRVLPVAFHQQSWNFSLLGGSLLFIGSRMTSGSPRLHPSEQARRGPRFSAAWKIAGVLAVLMVTDYAITVYGYNFPFHVSGYLLTWAWYVGICVLGMGLFRKITVLRVAAGAIAAPTSFFLLSNFAVWMGGMYTHTLSGLAQCYTMALPFYRNDLASTTLTVAALFGLPALAHRIVESFESANNNLAA
jgi:hypothetical protein